MKLVYLRSGIMQLAMLAPYSNLASSVAAALVPTLLGPKVKDVEELEPATFVTDTERNVKGKRE